MNSLSLVQGSLLPNPVTPLLRLLVYRTRQPFAADRRVPAQTKVARRHATRPGSIFAQSPATAHKHQAPAHHARLIFQFVRWTSSWRGVPPWAPFNDDHTCVD